MVWHYTAHEPNILTAWAGINLRDWLFFFFPAQEVKKFDDITTRAIQTYVDKLETLLVNRVDHTTLRGGGGVNLLKKQEDPF